MKISALVTLAKKTFSASGNKASKLTYATDTLQRNDVQNIQNGIENIGKILQNMDYEDKEALQQVLDMFKRYGFSQGELKDLTQNYHDLIQHLELFADNKFIEAIQSHKALLEEGIWGFITKDNKKGFIKLLRNKDLTDEQISSIKSLVTDENASILRQLLKDKNFNQKLLADLPASHLKRDNVEVLKQISKNGNVSTQEMIHLMSSTNKSNSDIAVKLLQKSDKNTEGLNFIIHSVYAPAQLSEEGLKAFQLRKNLLSELLENPEFKLGVEKDCYDNYYFISKVLSVVTPENYAMAKTALIERNTDLYLLADFLKDVTSENQSIAKQILNMASKDTVLPRLKHLNINYAAKYLDEVSKIKNPEIQSQYIDVIYNLKPDNIDEILQIIRTAKPENSKHTISLLSCITRGLKKEEAEPILKMIEQSGRNLNSGEIANLAVLSNCENIPAAKFVKRILSNKSVSDRQLQNLTYQYIETVQKIKGTKFDTPELHYKFNKDLINKQEYNRLSEQLFNEFVQKQDELIEKLPDILEKLLKNKNLQPYELESIFSQISLDNIGVIEKYAFSPKITKINLAAIKPDNIAEIEKLADLGVSMAMQEHLLPVIKNSGEFKEKQLEILPKLLNRENSLVWEELPKILSSIDDTTVKYIDEIIDRQDFSLSTITLLLKKIQTGQNTENIMKLLKDKGIKSEYLTQISEPSVFQLYEKNPELVKKALDLKVDLLVQNPKSKSFLSNDVVLLTDVIGEKRFTNILKGLEEAKTKYGIVSKESLRLQPAGNANDAFITLKGISDGRSLVFKFDKKTGKLITISQPDTAIHVPSGRVTTDTVSEEDKTLKNLKITPYKVNTITKVKNGEFGTVYTESAIKGQYDIFQTRPDGTIVRIGHALVTPNEAKHVRRTLTSTDGTKTFLAFREDKKGNSYFHSVITDKTGQKLSDVKRTFKVVSKNHFVSTKDGQAYDIVFTDKNVVVAKLDAAGKKTKEKVEFKIQDISLDDANEIALSLSSLDEKNIHKTAKIFKRYGIEPKTIDRRCVEMLKRLPGDEWFAMSKSCEFVMPQSVESMQAFCAGNSIFMSKELIHDLSVFSHELGHAKYYALSLGKDKELFKIYNAEKKAYTTRFPESRIEFIDYFLDENTAASKNGLGETAAEANLLTNTIQTWDLIQDRTIFLEQYFPKTIAYLRKKYTQLI